MTAVELLGGYLVRPSFADAVVVDRDLLLTLWGPVFDRRPVILSLAVLDDDVVSDQ